MPDTQSLTRREQLLQIAAGLFASKGFRNTTVRDIADAAGILSGSLYHHFDSKESMVDEILRTFQKELFGQYDEILASDADPRAKLEQAVRVSFDAIDRHHSEVAIFQNDAAYLGTLDGFGYIEERHAQSRDVWMRLLREGVAAGVLRDDLDVDLAYRFIRDTVWVAVNWYRPGGALTSAQVADQYVTILLEGVSAASGSRRSLSDRLETTTPESDTHDA
jgi:AcrR family transcriptional regulator